LFSIVQPSGSPRLLLSKGGDESQLQQALQKARDLEGLNINLEVFPVVPKSAEMVFDHEKFYNKVLNEMGQEEIEKGRGLELSDLYEEIKNKYAKQRASRTIPMRFGGAEGMEIGVELYTMMKSATKPAAQNITASTHREVKSETSYFSQLTGSDLPNEVLGRATRFAGAWAAFTKEEIDSIKQLGGAGIQILGFRDKEFVKKEYQLKANVFVRPTDKFTKGSVQTFTSLWSRLRARSKVAVASVRPSGLSAPRLAVLSPQSREDGFEAQDGFVMMYLPYKDDLRDPEPAMPVAGLDCEVDPEALKAGRNVVKCFSKLAKGQQFYNTSVQRFYAHLEAHALAQDEPRAVNDSLVPRLANLPTETSGFVAALGAALYPAEYIPDDAMALGTKKPATTKAATKRKAPEPIDLGDVDFAAKLADGTLSKMKVSELKDYCKANGLALSGKKADVLERITGHLLIGSDDAPPAKKAKGSDDDEDNDDGGAGPATTALPEAEDEPMAIDDDESPPAVSPAPVDEKPMCSFGLNCYRKNPQHFAQFDHPPGHQCHDD